MKGASVCSVGAHRVAVRPWRQRRRHASVIAGEVADHVVPEGGIHQEPVQQHKGRTVAAVSSYSIVPADSSIWLIVWRDRWSPK